MEKSVKFKSVHPVKVTHPRGTDIMEICGDVLSQTKTTVTLHNPFGGYDFKISMKDFLNANKIKNLQS